MTPVPVIPREPTARVAAWSRMGGAVYGIAAMLLGAVGLVSGDFAAVWQPVPAGVPGRKALAYLTAVCLVAAGAVIPWRRFARPGAIVLGVLYLVFALLWVPRVVAYPLIFGTWGGVFEQLSLVAAAVIVYASVHESDDSGAAANAGRILFGVCAVAFGLNHFFAIPETAAMVPKWIPPGPRFWAVATGVAHFLAGVAIISGVLGVVACRCLTVMVLLFGALVWLPALLAKPHDHTTWCGNAVNLTIAGAAWVVADWMARQRAQSLGEPSAREWVA